MLNTVVGDLEVEVTVEASVTDARSVIAPALWLRTCCALQTCSAIATRSQSAAGHVAMISTLLSVVDVVLHDMHASDLDADTWFRWILDEISLPGLPQFSPETIAGISVAITGNILISLALNCQKLAHRRLERDRQLRKTQLNGKATEPRHNGVNGSEQDGVLEDGEDDELTPTGLPLRNVSPLHEQDEPSESDPLLPHSPSESTSTRRAPRFRRLLPWSRRRDPDEHSDHSLLPVDVEPPLNSRIKRNKADGNESDYLKSKLWQVHCLLIPINTLLSP